MRGILGCAASPPPRQPNPWASVPVRIREREDLAAGVAVRRRVHEISGYPSCWPDDPGGRITSRTLVTAWVAGHDGKIANHVALVRGMRLECLLRAALAWSSRSHQRAVPVRRKQPGWRPASSIDPERSMVTAQPTAEIAPAGERVSPPSTT